MRRISTQKSTLQPLITKQSYPLARGFPTERLESAPPRRQVGPKWLKKVERQSGSQQGLRERSTPSSSSTRWSQVGYMIPQILLTFTPA
jgi:hypothetical protein